MPATGEDAPKEAAEAQLDEYPSLATSVDVDFKTRFNGVFLDFLISLPLLFLSMAPSSHIVGAALWCVYWLSRDAFLSGQSLGKRLVKERVVKLDGSRFTWKDSALRNITYLPSGLISLTAFLWITPDLLPVAKSIPGLVAITEIACVVFTQRRMGDFLAHTKVVHADARPQW